MTKMSLLRRLATATALALVASSPALAETIFTPAVKDFPGRVRFETETGAPITPGSEVVVSADRLPPGQKLTVMRGTHVLNADAPLTADAEGKASFRTTVDAEAAIGLQPIVVIGDNPSAATIVDLKISPVIPVSGAEKFDVTTKPVGPGLYQIAMGDEGVAYITSAVGRPPVKQSALLKIDTKTMDVIAKTQPAAAALKDGSDGGLLAVYGVGYDAENKNVWVTNTRQNTLAVYKADDLSLVKQFDEGIAPHARDVVIDDANGRAYVSAVATDEIKVFDLKTLEQLDPIKVRSPMWGKMFMPMSLDLDPESGTLFTVSYETPEAAIIDLKTGEAGIIPLTGVVNASGVARDAKDGLLFVTGQGTDNLQIIKADSGEVVHDVKVGAGPLSVTFEPVSRHAYVANRGSGTVTVVDTSGNIVANLEGGTFPNHLIADGKGAVWAVNKSLGEDDPNGDRLSRIAPKS